MNAHERTELAMHTLYQGLADLLGARAYLDGQVSLTFSTPLGRLELAHMAVSKSHQSVEKVLKGYLVFHGQSINPFRGHDPLTRVMNGEGGNASFLLKFRTTMRQSSGGIIHRLLSMEQMAPNPPPVQDLDQIELTDLPINTEYPFWDNAAGYLTSPAIHFKRADAFNAIRVTISLCEILAGEDDDDYTQGLRRFLETFPLD
jgi:hypothetical protein